MTPAAAENEENGAAPRDAERPCAEPPARTALRQRNRMLAAALAGIAAAMLVVVVTLAVMFHYAEAHHVIAAL